MKQIGIRCSSGRNLCEFVYVLKNYIVISTLLGQHCDQRWDCVDVISRTLWKRKICEVED